MPRKRASKGPRSRSAREARAKRDARYTPTIAPNVIESGAPCEALSPRELYLREKALRASRRPPNADDPLAQAQRQYNALLAADAEAGRGGRPKKMVAARKAALDQANDD